MTEVLTIVITWVIFSLCGSLGVLWGFSTLAPVPQGLREVSVALRRHLKRLESPQE